MDVILKSRDVMDVILKSCDQSDACDTGRDHGGGGEPLRPVPVRPPWGNLPLLRSRADRRDAPGKGPAWEALCAPLSGVLEGLATRTWPFRA